MIIMDNKCNKLTTNVKCKIAVFEIYSKLPVLWH